MGCNVYGMVEDVTSGDEDEADKVGVGVLCDDAFIAASNLAI